jgi:glycosyltransferase involved in cell wall biosynthesis
VTSLRPLPSLSVVLPVRNGRATLAAALSALQPQSYAGDWELVVVDNGSSDGTADLARQWSDRLPLRIVDASDKRGIGHARNVGAAAARGEILAFCEADDEAADGWLAGIAEVARRSDIVCGRLDYLALNRDDGLPPGDASTEIPVPLGFLPYAPGANFAVRRDVALAIGWDERYTRAGEDVDFSWRAQLSGYSVSYAADAVVKYRRRQQLSAVVRQQFGYGIAVASLCRDFRQYGLLGRPQWMKSGAWLAVHFPDLLHAKRRARWIYIAAYLTGWAWGSISWIVRNRLGRPLRSAKSRSREMGRSDPSRAGAPGQPISPPK